MDPNNWSTWSNQVIVDFVILVCVIAEPHYIYIYKATDYQLSKWAARINLGGKFYIFCATSPIQIEKRLQKIFPK